MLSITVSKSGIQLVYLDNFKVCKHVLVVINYYSIKSIVVEVLSWDVFNFVRGSRERVNRNVVNNPSKLLDCKARLKTSHNILIQYTVVILP